jgi:hypothetical protein
MPMPRLPETHHSTNVAATAGQLKVKSAATAQMWKIIMALHVAQFIPDLPRPISAAFSITTSE